MPMSKVRWWFLVVCLSAVIVYVDYITPPEFQFPALFILPVLLATWFIGVVPGIGFAILLPLVRLSFVVLVWHGSTETPFIGSVNLGIRVATFSLLVVLTQRIKTL